MAGRPEDTKLMLAVVQLEVVGCMWVVDRRGEDGAEEGRGYARRRSVVAPEGQLEAV